MFKIIPHTKKVNSLDKLKEIIICPIDFDKAWVEMEKFIPNLNMFMGSLCFKLSARIVSGESFGLESGAHNQSRSLKNSYTEVAMHSHWK